jgi:RNA polymerase sigma-B factor
MSAMQPHLQARRARHERALFERVADDGDARARARDELVDRFLPLAYALALRYRDSHESLDDLVQVASVGLLKAIDRFDSTRGIAFSAFAVPTMLGEIRRHVRDRTWAVRVPRDVQELSLRVDRFVGGLAGERRRQPSIAQIAAAVGASAEDVLEALQAGGSYRARSFDASGGGDRYAPTVRASLGVEEDGFERAEDRATLQALMELVSPREREVLRLRFVEDMTQAEIGAVIGVSQMQVSRIIRSTLERLRAVAEPAFAALAWAPLD